MPDIPSKVCLDDYKALTDAERYLIGFNLCRGKAKPRRTGHGQNSWSKDKVRIASDLHKIKHWRIFQKSYNTAPNELATWFIDPPYQQVQLREGNTDRYPHWAVDYNELTDFIKERKGLVIACEGDQANYLPFEHLVTVNTNTNNHSVKKNNEMVYIQDIC